MRDATLRLYATFEGADDAARYRAQREAKHGIRTSVVVEPDVAARLGPTILIGRYAPAAPIYWETNVYGRRVWMMGGMHRILLAARAEIEAGRDLSGTVIARIAGVSQGYVSKALRWLDRFGFITILGVFRGRWGRIVAKLKSIIPPPPIGLRSTGGMIKPQRSPRTESGGLLRRTGRLSDVDDRRLGELGPGSSPDRGPMSLWSQRVLLERARLAIVDPAGEAEALEPLSPAQAWALLERGARAEEVDRNWRITHALLRPEYNDDELLFRLGGDPARGSGMTYCPGHADVEHKSLSWRVENGKLLLHCFAGCTWQEIVDAV